MHARIIVFCIVGMLSKTWTNALYVLQIDTKTMLVIVVAITKVQQIGTKGRATRHYFRHIREAKANSCDGYVVPPSCRPSKTLLLEPKGC